MNQTLFISRNCHVTLYREIQTNKGGLQYVEGPRLLRDFFVGGVTKVGSIHTRTFGTDYWVTSNVIELTKIVNKPNNLVHIYYRTRNTPYILEVKSENIIYRDDLKTLIDLTQNGGLASDKWLTEAKLFTEMINNEYRERRKKECIKFKGSFKEKQGDLETKEENRAAEGAIPDGET